MAQEHHHHHQEQSYAQEPTYSQEQTYADEAPVHSQTPAHVPGSVTSYDNQSQAGEPTPFISSQQMEAEQQRQMEAEDSERAHYTNA